MTSSPGSAADVLSRARASPGEAAPGLSLLVGLESGEGSDPGGHAPVAWTASAWGRGPPRGDEGRLRAHGSQAQPDSAGLCRGLCVTARPMRRGWQDRRARRPALLSAPAFAGEASATGLLGQSGASRFRTLPAGALHVTTGQVQSRTPVLSICTPGALRHEPSYFRCLSPENETEPNPLGYEAESEE